MPIFPGSNLYPSPSLFPGTSLDVGVPLGVGQQGGLNVTWWAIHPTTGVRVPLPNVGAWSLSPIANAPGAISMDYPVVGLNYATLNTYVTDRRDLDVEIWFEGTQAGALRGVLCERSSDAVDDARVVSFSGHFLEWRMGKILVAPYDGDEKKETVFSGVSPGSLMGTLMARAHARGTATDITYASFSTTADSNGQAWDTSISATYSPVQTTYLQVLDDLVEQGACEWDITAAKQLRLFKAGTRGVDRTAQANPVVLRKGRNLTEVPTKVSSREAGTDLWGVGGEGLYHLEFDATARTLKGRQDEVAYSASGVKDPGALDAATTARLPAVIRGRREVTHGVLFGAGDPLPLAGFHLGDYVYSNTTETAGLTGGGNERLRIAQWTLSRSADGKYSGTISLNDLFDEQLVRIARQLNRLQSGTTVVGTSTASPADPDTMPPAAPTGVVVSSTAYQDGANSPTWAAIFVSWSAVTLNQDGTVIADLAGYTCRYRYRGLVQTGGIGEPGEFIPGGGDGRWNFTADSTSTSVQESGVEANVAIEVQVAAFDSEGNLSAWSTGALHTTANDNVPPPTPSTPVARNFLRQLIVDWDGLGSAGESMPVDFQLVRAYANAANNFATAELFGELFAAGSVVFDPGAYTAAQFFWLVAGDRAGNQSDPSASATATPSRAIADDIGDQVITGAKLVNETIGSGQLAAGAVIARTVGANQVLTEHLTVANFSDNLLPNGGFEDAAVAAPTQPASWVVGTNTGGTHTFTRNTAAANVHSGGASAQLAMSAASGTFEIRSTVVPTKPGDNWYVELNAKASRALSGLHVYLLVGDSDPPTAATATLLTAGALTTSYPATPLGFNYAVPATVGAGVVPKYLQVVVRTGLVVGDGAALTVWADEVRARKVVGTAEIQDLAVSRAKIGLLAVGDAQIETLSVGKVTAGTLSATVTLSGIIQTAATGQRMRIDGAGWRAYRADGTTIFAELNIATSSMLVTGEIRTGISGERILMLQDGSMQFYPAAGSNFSEIANNGNELYLRGPLNGSNESGQSFYWSSGVGLAFGAYPAGLTSRLSVGDRLISQQATVLVNVLDGRYTPPPGDTQGHRVLWKAINSSGVDIPNSYLHLSLSLNSNRPWLFGATTNTGIQLNEALYVVDNFGNGKGVYASNFAIYSSLARKDDVAPAEFGPSRLTATGVVQAARARRWRYRHDLEPRPPKPGVMLQRLDEHGDSVPHVEAEWAHPQQPAPLHVGPMADDLLQVAPELVMHTAEGEPMLDIGVIAGVAYEAAAENADHLEQLRGELAELRRLVSGPDPMVVDGEVV